MGFGGMRRGGGVDPVDDEAGVEVAAEAEEEGEGGGEEHAV